MKRIITSTFLIGLCSTSFANVTTQGDVDCRTPSTSVPTAQTCACILDNAYNDAGGVYPKSALDLVFRNAPELAIQTCENIEQGDPNGNCKWGVDFYDAPASSCPVPPSTELNR